MGELFNAWFTQHFDRETAAALDIDPRALREPWEMVDYLERSGYRSVQSLLLARGEWLVIPIQVILDADGTSVLPGIVDEINNEQTANAPNVRSISPRSWLFYFLLRMFGERASRHQPQLEQFSDAHIFYARKGEVVRRFMQNHWPERGDGLRRFDFYFKPYAALLEQDYERFANSNYATSQQAQEAFESTRTRNAGLIAMHEARGTRFHDAVFMDDNLATRAEERAAADRYYRAQQEEKARAERQRDPIPDATRRLLEYASRQPFVAAAKRKADEQASEEAKRQRLRAMARRKARAAAVKTRPTKAKAKPSKTRTTSTVVKRAARPTKR